MRPADEVRFIRRKVFTDCVKSAEDKFVKGLEAQLDSDALGMMNIHWDDKVTILFDLSQTLNEWEIPRWQLGPLGY